MPVARSIGWSAALRSAVSLAAAALGSAVAAGDLQVTPSSPSGPNIPVIFYTDLTDGAKTGGLNNNGIWVTLFVKNAGATRGSGTVTLGGGEVASYVFWSDTKIIVQLGNNVATGNFVVQNNDGLSSSAGGCIEKPPDSTNDFTVRSQPIFFIAATGTNGNGAHDTPLVQATNRIRDNFVAGAIYIFRGGTYNQQLVVNGWGNNVLNLGGTHSGAANAHTAFVAYPGEAVTLQIAGVSSVYLRDGNETVANYTTFANFIMRGESSCFGGGAQTSAGQQLLNSGGQRVRLVNCDMRALSTGNTMTGIVSIGGNGARLHGNKLHDTGYPTDATVLDTGFDPPYFNNNHAIYIQCGASDVVLSDNDLRDLNMGATVQIHTDRFFPYYGVHIRRNKFIQRASAATHQARGIVAGDISGDSWGSIVDNVFDRIGTDGPFPPIAIYSGTWKIHNNTIYNCPSGVPLVLLSHQVSSDTNYVGIETWSPPHLDMRNNIMHSAGGGPYYAFGGSGTPGGLATSAQITAANNLYSGAGAGPSFDATKVDAAHGMTDPANEDYTLTLGSAARNAGTATGLDSTAMIDRFGISRPQQGTIDIGAHEYAVAPPSLGVYNQGYQQQGLGSNPLTVVAGDTQVAGSSLLVFSAAKLDDVTSVTHNKSGTLSNLGSLAYTFWGPYGARLDAVSALTGGTGQSASISLIAGNATDEKTMFVLEVRNGQTITLATPVELPASGATVVTGNNISTSGPAVLFCCVWGDGNISTPMNLTVHADSIAEGWVQIGDVSIDGIAHIQGALAVRVVSGAGGPYSCKWNFTPAQRALFFTGKVEA